MNKVPDDVESIVFRYVDSTKNDAILEPIIGELSGKELQITHRVIASVRFLNGDIREGDASCSNKDPYNKNTGRLIAVNRALGKGRIRSYQVIRDWFREKDEIRKTRLMSVSAGRLSYV